MVEFEDIIKNPTMLRAIKELNFKEPSEIQEKVIPLALAGKDVIGQSATGSGKTLAFGVPIIEKVESRNGLQALILTPTRELAEQISGAMKIFSRYKPLKISTVYGGVSIGNQIDELKRSEIVVGTPGRVLDHLKRRTMDLSKIKVLVLDEADRMLDMGFIYDVTDIIHHCPSQRQSLLFSATVSEEIVKISKKYMHSPIEVSAEPNVDPSKLEQVYYDVPSSQKFSLLVHLLKEESSKLVMIFCNTKRNADLIANNLRKQDFDAQALHGDLNQSKRIKVLEHFHKSTKFILVCTDVAARGLDIKGVSHVYNYESPKTSIEYIHRIGRTARAGKEGKAITIISDRDYESFRRIMQDDTLNIQSLDLPQFERIFVQMRGDHSRESRDYSRGREHGQYRGREGSRNNSGSRNSSGSRRPRSTNFHKRRDSRSTHNPRSFNKARHR